MTEEISDEDSTGKVAQCNQDQIADRLPSGNPACITGQRNSHHVAGQELTAADQDQNQANREHRRSDKGREASPCGRCACGNADRQQKSERYESPRCEAQSQNGQQGRGCFFVAGFDGVFGNFFWSQI
ncbi:hypothetical protein D3C75_794450 [compost metagenome]